MTAARRSAGPPARAGDGFQAFEPEMLEFLMELRFHNERDWFLANQHRYERYVREPALAFIEAMKPRLEAISPELNAVAKKVGGSLMRIHRDLRFAKDASPYKTNIGIHFTHKHGEDSHGPVLYMHIEPDSAFLAAGSWHPPAAALASFREAIDRDPKAWLAARDKPSFRADWQLSGESLKRAPTGYATDHALIEDIKRKDFIAVKMLSEDDVLAPSLPDRAAAAYATATPYMQFLCSALGLPY
jgi:uncharacterized protein (TIGR02453 family)